MFGKRYRLFTLVGFDVRVDASWLFLVILIVWSLADGYFPATYKNLPEGVYWAMGIVGALGFFASIVLHELSHSIVARRYGIPMKGITLFIFGGVAEMDDEPPSARSEFMMAIAGPLASVLLAFLFYVLYVAGHRGAWPDPLVGILGYLAYINSLLVAFNVLPAFPLDGGRVLRSVLWAWKHSLRRATRIASAIGSGFGVLFVAAGVYLFIRGDFIGGLWLSMIGLFLRGASRMSYQQLILRKTLEGEPVLRFMKTDPISVPRHISVEDLVNHYVYRYHFKMFPVVDGDRLMGCVSTRDIKDLPRTDWDRHTVGEIAEACTEQNTIAPQTDAMHALSMMSRTGKSRLLVVDDGHLKGIIALKDMLKFLALKMDLEAKEILAEEDHDD